MLFKNIFQYTTTLK